MEQGQSKPVGGTAGINPVQDPQILPFTYAMPVCSPRFASPAASICLPRNFLDLFLKRK